MNAGQIVFIIGELIGVIATLWLAIGWLTCSVSYMNWKENTLAAVITLLPWAYVPWLVYGIWWVCRFTYNTIQHLPYCS